MKFDFFALFILLGIAQAFFLGGIFYFYHTTNKLSNRLLAILMWALGLSIGEIFLCYTNLMFQIVWLVDAVEPINFIIAPLFYLYLQSKLEPEKKKLTPQDYLHFLPFLLYLVYMCVLVFPQELAYKYNCYVSAYHPALPHVKAHVYWAYWQIFWVREHVSHLTFLHLAIYQTLSFIFIQKKYSNALPDLVWAKSLWLKFASILVLFLIIKLNFANDLGDHILAFHITIVVYMISFQVIKQSILVRPIQISTEQAGKKYEKSSLTLELQTYTLRKLDELMQAEKPYLLSDFSLPMLAQRLNVSVHHLSQILNEQIGQNFFEFMATHRIKEAQRLLHLPEMAHLKIEEIAERVGYSSKSSFNLAFKKIVGETPSIYKNR